MKNKVQQFGKFLSAMVMPNIGALIAFGFLAALFIDTGWIPNKNFNTMVGPMLTYLIPILIASTGGKMVGGDRGRVVGAIAVIGAIMSNTEITMLMAAMLMGPLGGFCIKKFDQLMEGRMPAGFEMLINNFSVGIIGLLLALLGYVGIGPLMSAILAVLTAGVNVLVKNSLLPLPSTTGYLLPLPPGRQMNWASPSCICWRRIPVRAWACYWLICSSARIGRRSSLLREQ